MKIFGNTKWYQGNSQYAYINSDGTSDIGGGGLGFTLPLPNVSEGATATSDGNNGASWVPGKACDGDSSSFWEYTASYPHWLKFDIGSAKLIAAYGFFNYPQADFTGRMPRDWTFQGSNDDSNWTTLDTRSSIGFSSGLTIFIPSPAPGTAYRYYKWNCTAGNYSSIIRVGEAQIFDTTTDFYNLWYFANIVAMYGSYTNV